MTARKRKAPDRRKTARREPGFLPRLAAGAGRAAARHPRPLIGCAAFGVVFSFVAANALWYQPGGHPSPFLATRDAQDRNGIAGYRPMRRETPGDVTTFRIERAAPAASPASPPPAPQNASPRSASPPADPQAPQPMPPKPASRPVEKTATNGDDPVAAAIRSAERRPFTTPPADIPNATGSNPRPAPPSNAQRPAPPAARRPASPAMPASGMVLQIQRGLSNIAYADVEVDGVAGSRTKAAIRRFQKHYRLPETGEPDEQVLKKLKSIGAL